MSLTQTAYTSRNLIKYGGVSLIAFVFLWSIASISIKAYQAAHPKYISPTVRYGILPKNIFSTKDFLKKNFTFEFTNDVTPAFGDQSKVYIIYRSTTEILALEEAKEVAKDFGFTEEPSQISAGSYEFKDSKNNRTLTMNVLEGNFSLRYPYTNDDAILNPKEMPSKEKAISTAESFLESGNKYGADLKAGIKEVTYWKIADGNTTAVSALSEANAIRVNFYRQKIDDKYEIVSSQNGQATVSILISGANESEKKIIEADFNYATIDRESYSTYPIKTTQQAMSDLTSGNYWPSSDVSLCDVTIKSVELAYYEPVTLTQYLQPIYVFKGDNNFVAYVTAVTDKYVTE